MPDQAYAFLGVFLFSVLLIVAVLPAPSRPPRNEYGLHLTLLGAGAGFAILAGILALLALPVHSAIVGALAWLTVMPCVWMARGPRTAEGYGYEEEDEDDDGEDPWPRVPGAPSVPGDRRPQLGSAGLAGPRVAWARPAARPAPAAHVVATPRPAPFVVSGPLFPKPTRPTLQAEPAAATHERRLQPSPRRVRADHRSIVHKRAPEPHGARRRRASLHRRVLNRCRAWLWVEQPECVTYVAPGHDEPRRRPGTERHHDARSTPLV